MRRHSSAARKICQKQDAPSNFLPTPAAAEGFEGALQGMEDLLPEGDRAAERFHHQGQDPGAVGGTPGGRRARRRALRRPGPRP